MCSQQIVQQLSSVLFNINGVQVQVNTNKVSKWMQTVQQQVVMTKQRSYSASRRHTDVIDPLFGHDNPSINEQVDSSVSFYFSKYLKDATRPDISDGCTLRATTGTSHIPSISCTTYKCHNNYCFLFGHAQRHPSGIWFFGDVGVLSF